MLEAYTVSFVDAHAEKVCIDFVNPELSDLEIAELLCFFRKYKRETYVKHESKNIINFIVVHWSRWAEFLLKLGFKDTAYAFGEVLRDMYKDVVQHKTTDEYVDELKNAKILNPLDKKSAITTDKQKERYEWLKLVEIRRLTKNKEEIEKKNNLPFASLAAFTRDFERLSCEFPNMYIAYKSGELLGVGTDRKQLLLTVDYDHGVKPDLIKKVAIDEWENI